MFDAVEQFDRSREDGARREVRTSSRATGRRCRSRWRIRAIDLPAAAAAMGSRAPSRCRPTPSWRAVAIAVGQKIVLECLVPAAADRRSRCIWRPAPERPCRSGHCAAASRTAWPVKPAPEGVAATAVRPMTAASESPVSFITWLSGCTSTRRARGPQSRSSATMFASVPVGKMTARSLPRSFASAASHSRTTGPSP